VIDKTPVPLFPRWTGVTATIGQPHEHRIHHGDGFMTISVPVSVQPTRRALWWAHWRMLTGRWPVDAAP